MSSNTSQVRVAVRIRPLSLIEKEQGGEFVLEADSTQRTVGLMNRKFTYDAVYDSQVSQSELYELIRGKEDVNGMLSSFLEGYNATILAYGQTGSGKTFTMGSEASTNQLQPQPSLRLEHSQHAEAAGLIPRFMSDIFSNLKLRHANHNTDASRNQLVQFEVKASFLEVYGEDIHDLLRHEDSDIISDAKATSLPVREDGNGGVMVVGLKLKNVENAEDACRILQFGTLNRTTAATLMNHTSSRSHAVFTIYLTQTIRQPGSTLDLTLQSRFNFVDLAGSERMKKTGAEGDRAKEGIEINKGLLALGNVINALADDDRLIRGEKIHVPYRQSKLTRLLQDALGGNSQTLFLACVSPSDTNISETISTLQYANRARNIKNAPTKNIDATLAELQRMQALNHILTCELIKYKFGLGVTECYDSELIGHVPNHLFHRQDVQHYLQRVVGTIATSTPPGNQSEAIYRAVISFMGASPVLSVGSSFDLTNSEGHPMNNTGEALMNDMTLLDKLMELQHQDQEYNNRQRQELDKIDEVKGQIEEKECLLQQLKDNLKIYHSMKEKYELQVQALQNEKTQLASELNHALLDPSKGCSKSIQKKLEMVEANLAKARLETKRHQDMYRKAEHEAQRCHELEKRIILLKQDHVALMKKQREAATKHREFVEAKRREIETLKRNERRTGHKVSKLEAEIHRHKATLIKRNNYCEKLTEKLKETELRLVKLSSSKKRERHETGYSTLLEINNKEMDDLAAPVVDEEEVNSVQHHILIKQRGHLPALTSSMPTYPPARQSEYHLYEDFQDKSLVHQSLRTSDIRSAELEDKLALMTLGLVNGPSEEAKTTMSKIQELWLEMGTSMEEREETRNHIARCLEDTCLRELSYVTTKQDMLIRSLEYKTHELQTIYSALGISEVPVIPNTSLAERLLFVESFLKDILPRFNNALERRTNLVTELDDTILTLHLPIDTLAENLKRLLDVRRHTRTRLGTRPKLRNSKKLSPHVNSSKEQRENILREVEEVIKALDETRTDTDEKPNYNGRIFDRLGKDNDATAGRLEVQMGSLTEAFLDGCERDLELLRATKALTYTSNSCLVNDARQMCKNMHIRRHELNPLVTVSIETKQLPHWWINEVADDVCRCIFSKEDCVRVTKTFTMHLSFVVEVLRGLSAPRNSLSSTLHRLVKEAQKQLLATVEGEAKGYQAYSNFQNALSRLPSLSNEYIRACIDEINNLVATVEAMSQSEIEALTVLWEALNLGPPQRGVFWSKMEFKPDIDHHPGLFQEENELGTLLLSYKANSEEWLRECTNEAIISCKTWHEKLFKFSIVHKEVDKLKSQQTLRGAILAIDSEIGAMHRTLSESENKASDSSRKMTQLDEERQRTQADISSKLQNLTQQLLDWEIISGGYPFDKSILSDLVRQLVDNKSREKGSAIIKTGKHNIRNKATLQNGEPGVNDNMKSLQASIYSRSKEQSPSRPRKISAKGTDKCNHSVNLLTSPVERDVIRKRDMNSEKKVNEEYKSSIGKGRPSVILPFGEISSNSPISKENSVPSLS